MKEEYIHDTDFESEGTFQQIKKLALRMLSKWYWIALSLTLALAIAYFVTASSERIYEVSASVLIKDPNQKGNSVNTVSDIIYGEELLNTSSSIENEIFLIKRFDLIKTTLKDLNYEVIVYEENSPINVVIDTSFTYQPVGAVFTCIILDNKFFRLTTDDDDLEVLIKDKRFEFGKTVSLDEFGFIVYLDRERYFEKIRALKKEDGDEEASADNLEVVFQVNDLDKLADYYSSALKVEPVEEKSSILKLSLESSWPAKELKFLDALTENYLVSGLKEKVSTATQTMNFLDSQLAFISDSLNAIEGIREGFKTTNTIDLSKEGDQLYKSIQELEEKKAHHLIQIDYLNYLKNYIRDKNNELEYVTVPSSLGLNDPVLNSLIDQLITEQIKLNQVSGKLETPSVRMAKEKVEGLRRNISETANNLLKGNRIALSDLESRIGRFSGELKSLPAAERELINIERQHNLSETLYLFLMEKRTESGILKASTAPDFKVVNSARIQNGGRPIKPKPLINYATATLLGLFIPIMFIYFGDKFNDKIKTPEELTALAKVPFLGMIRRNKVDGKTCPYPMQPSVAESFRSIRSNLRYMTEDAKGSKTFMISSFISGEGKSFCAKSLAYIFAISGKKTVYVNTDLRKNNSYEEFGLTKTTGLTEYLIYVVPGEAIIHKTAEPNMFVIPGGKIPPNPSELLMTERFKDLMDHLKKHFDYIIMDTPPRGILSDAMELIKYADVELFVIRQNVTSKGDIKNLNRMYEAKKYSHPMGIILNDVDFSKIEYRMNAKNAYAYNYNI